MDVQIGDKLKVYYGDKPIQDSKVTYEAKVCVVSIIVYLLQSFNNYF